MAGNDLAAMTPEVKEILTNPEVIAVDQDPLGDAGPQGVRRRAPRGLDEAARRRLAGGHPLQPRHRGGRLSVRWEDIGLFPGGGAAVRDLWAKKEVALENGPIEAKPKPSRGRDAPRQPVD